GLGTEITALNFGVEPLEETITLAGIASQPVRELLRDEAAGGVDAQGRFSVRLEGHAGKAYIVDGKASLGMICEGRCGCHV
ncbi:MAG TPA: hypothetical protein PL187_20180, partial [Caldilinea sp.]|nr:hypothetical protein [Caldilinea sp.]